MISAEDALRLMVERKVFEYVDRVRFGFPIVLVRLTEAFRKHFEATRTSARGVAREVDVWRTEFFMEEGLSESEALERAIIAWTYITYVSEFTEEELATAIVTIEAYIDVGGKK